MCGGERGHEQGVVWQPQGSLGVGDKITANKAKPSKPNPVGKGGRLICKAEAAPWGPRDVDAHLEMQAG